MKALTLSKSRSITIRPTHPFNFDATVHKPSHFPDQLTVYEKGKLWQTLRLNGRIFGAKLENKGAVSRPLVKLTVFSNGNIADGKLKQAAEELCWYYDLNADLRCFFSKFAKELVLGPVIRKWSGMRVSSAHSLYELLVVGIVLQNATVRRSVQMLASLLENYGMLVKFGGKTMYAMWAPGELAKVGEQELRALKVGYRAKFLVRLSGDFAEGKVDEPALRAMGKEQAKKELMKLYGVGPETARILLFEALHHYDAFDHIAPWQQKIYSHLFYGKRLVPVSRMSSDIKRRYGKWSMLAVHYLWEDLFWKRKTQHIDWLEKEIRL
ncbi:hypothetical protein HYS54_03925 [Candidatus Micrarchaeota archaeon]|nr:hypothetical protein [Candidatus Micrarchaeota archaeon]